MGAYEIESLFKECENLDDAVYRPENFAILKYCYENYEFNSDIDDFIERVSPVQKRLIFCRSPWKKNLMTL